MGLYLKGSSSIEILDEYNGEKGFFIKTFALNTKRNKNGWRVTWDSIKKRINDFSDNLRPGILYTKCTQAGCDLDHTDAETYQSSLHVQEPFRVTDIVGNTLDEENETAYFIHKITNASEMVDQETLDKFKQDIMDGVIQFVSPSVWPISGQYDIKKGERMPNGEPIIDAYDWLALHDAFVNDPAFGPDARVTATCEGEDCQVKLLTAKELGSDSIPETLPVMIRHKEHLHFVSATKKMSDEIQAQIDFSGKLDPKQLPDIFKNNSFSACTCSTLRMIPEEALKAKLTATEKDSADKDDKIKNLESRLTAMEKEKSDAAEKAKSGAISACGKCGSTKHTSENHTDDNDGEGVEKMEAKSASMKALTTKISTLESKQKKPMIVQMLKAREIAGVSTEDLATLEKSLDAKSLEEVESIFTNEQVFLKAATVEQPEEGIHMPFNGATSQGSLNGKTLEEIAGET